MNESICILRALAGHTITLINCFQSWREWVLSKWWHLNKEELPGHGYTAMLPSTLLKPQKTGEGQPTWAGVSQRSMEIQVHH